MICIRFFHERNDSGAKTIDNFPDFGYQLRSLAHILSPGHFERYPAPILVFCEPSRLRDSRTKWIFRVVLKLPVHP